MRLCQDLVTATTPNATQRKTNYYLALVTRLGGGSCVLWPVARCRLQDTWRRWGEAGGLQKGSVCGKGGGYGDAP